MTHRGSEITTNGCHQSCQNKAGPKWGTTPEKRLATSAAVASKGSPLMRKEKGDGAMPCVYILGIGERSSWEEPGSDILLYLSFPAWEVLAP